MSFYCETFCVLFTCAGITFKTEVRFMEKPAEQNVTEETEEPSAGADAESASSSSYIPTRNLLGVRENFTLQVSAQFIKFLYPYMELLLSDVTASFS